MDFQIGGPGAVLSMGDEEGTKGQQGGDAELVSRCEQGDEAAFAQLVERHLPRLLSVARRMLGNDQDAEDVAQEALLRLWRHAGNFDPERAKLSTWLYRVTSNLCVDRIRKIRETDLEDAPEPAMAAQQDLTVLKEQRARRVDLALQSLPERQRLAIVLFHLEELSQAEAATVLGCSVEAVESLLSRGRRSLKDVLKEDWQQLMPGDIGS